MPKTKKSTKSSSPRNKKPFVIIGLILGVLLIGFAGLYMLGDDDELDIEPYSYSESRRSTERERPNPPSGSIEQDPELTSILRSVGATELDNLSLTYDDNIEEGTDGLYEAMFNEETGELDYGVITIARGLDAEELKRTLAHEYLHFVWDAFFDDEERDELTSHLIVMYSDDDYMKQYTMTPYADDGILLPTELFSFYCTESSDQYLRSAVLERCNEFINRSALVMIR